MVTFNLYFGSTPDSSSPENDHVPTRFSLRVYGGDPVSKQPTHLNHWPTGVGGVDPNDLHDFHENEGIMKPSCSLSHP